MLFIACEHKLWPMLTCGNNREGRNKRETERRHTNILENYVVEERNVEMIRIEMRQRTAKINFQLQIIIRNLNWFRVRCQFHSRKQSKTRTSYLWLGNCKCVCLLALMIIEFAYLPNISVTGLRCFLHLRNIFIGLGFRYIRGRM